jgi:hypothetical protein
MTSYDLASIICRPHGKEYNKKGRTLISNLKNNRILSEQITAGEAGSHLGIPPRLHFKVTSPPNSGFRRNFYTERKFDTRFLGQFFAKNIELGGRDLKPLVPDIT